MLAPEDVRADVVALARAGAAMTVRPAEQRLRRLLVMLPWLMERGEVPVSEVAERFDLSEQDVVGDLELAAMCGLPPFVDELIDVFIDEGMIVVGVPRLFTRPLRLNSVEAFELLAAARAAMELPGADPDGALARGLAKLARALGEDDTAGVKIELDKPELVDRLATAATAHEQLRIDYVGADRDETTSAADRPPPSVHRSRRVVRQRRRRPIRRGADVPRRPHHRPRPDGESRGAERCAAAGAGAGSTTSRSAERCCICHRRATG